MNKFIIFTIIFFVTGCTSSLVINGGYAKDNGLKTQLISLDKDKVICYSEIIENNLGISCQDLSGISLFNVKVIDGRYNLDNLQSYLSPIKPSLVIHAIYASRYADYINTDKDKKLLKTYYKDNSKVMVVFENDVIVEVQNI